MSNRFVWIHRTFVVCDIILCIVSAILIVKTFNAGMMPLCFLNAAIFVANAYLAYFNFCEAKRLL